MLSLHLKKELERYYDIRFLTQNKKKSEDFYWNVATNEIDENCLQGVDHVIHLAGASIADKRWTRERKAEIINSRVNSARLIFNLMEKKQVKLKSFITASAVGYYGSKPVEEVFNESSAAGEDFLSEVCQLWENAAELFRGSADRITKLRLGVVIGSEAEIVQRMRSTVQLGFGAGLGNGKQFLPWIDLEDAVSIIHHLLKNPELKGIYNVVSPEHITNSAFTEDFAKAMNKKIMLPNVPGFVLKAMFGEASVLFLKGNRISAQKIINSGYVFKYPTLKSSLSRILGAKS